MRRTGTGALQLVQRIESLLAKIKIEVVRDVRPTDSNLCCVIHPDYCCLYCGQKLCKMCAQRWSGRKHFILDQCRKRFTESDILAANICFKKRFVNGEIPKGLGDCKICLSKKKLGINDRGRISLDD